jgi:UDPglucose--hexose-1-phosphate uridylyltransferase
MLREHRPSFDTLGDEVLAAVAERLCDTMGRLEEVLVNPPHTVLLHTAPVAEDGSLFFDWHAEIIPRLLPVPGLAWGGGLHINPVSPEEAAAALRAAR